MEVSGAQLRNPVNPGSYARGGPADSLDVTKFTHGWAPRISELNCLSAFYLLPHLIFFSLLKEYLYMENNNIQFFNLIRNIPKISPSKNNNNNNK